MNKNLAAVLEKEVTRKEFLKLSGFAVASIFGFGTIVKILLGQPFSTQKTSGGYGSSPYGGGADSRSG